jgi:hypothetical protein
MVDIWMIELSGPEVVGEKGDEGGFTSNPTFL